MSVEEDRVPSEPIDKSEIEAYVSDTRRQEARIELREKFLRVIADELGSECVMKTIENNEISGEFSGFDSYFETLLIKDLITPISGWNMPLSRIRTSDLQIVTFKNPKYSSNNDKGSKATSD